MDGGQNESLVFHSDDISSTQSHRNKDNYFVRVTKNPILRFLLREKKEEPKPEVKPQPVVVQAPVKPKPQFRATIRLSTLRLENLKKTVKKTVTILSIAVAVLVMVIGGLSFWLYTALAVPRPTTEGEIMSARKEMLKLVEQPVMTDNLSSVVAKMDEQISLVPEGELRQSLKVYKMFLLMDAGYFAEALSYFEQIEGDSFTTEQRCELYKYRLELSNKVTGSSEGSYREKYENLCLDEQARAAQKEEGKKNETEV